MLKQMELIFKRGFWVVILAWIFVIYKIKEMFGFYSADSYGIYFLGKNIIENYSYYSPAIRDFYLDPTGPLLSRSYPPLFPLLLGITDFFLNERIAAGTVANIFIAMGVLYIWFNISKRSANHLFIIPFIIPILYTFVPSDHALWRDAIAGRTSLLTLFLLLVTLLLLSRSTLFTDNKTSIGIGIFLGLLTLARFDAILFCFALPAIIFLTTRLSIKKTLLMYGALILAMLPWAIRNFIVFGTFLASDNSITALTNSPGIVQLLFLEQGIPNDLIGNPDRWLQIRISYLIGNFKLSYALLTSATLWLNILIKMVIFLYPPGLLYSFMHRKENSFLWIYFISSLTWCIFNLICVSLTSYGGDPRYHAISWFLIAGGSALFVAAVIQKLLNLRFKYSSSPKPEKISSTMMIAESLLCIMTVFVTIHLYSKTLYYNYHDYFWKWADHIENAPVKKGEFVAAIQAEKVAYYTGWNTIYLPGSPPRFNEAATNAGNSQAWKDYRAWLKRWKPSYLLIEIYDFNNPLATYPHATALTILDTMTLLKINLDESALTDQDAANDTKVRNLWDQQMRSKITPPATFYLNTNDYINGVAVKWEGFYVPNTPENQKKFAEGRVVLLPNGEQRLIKNTYYTDSRWNVRVYGGLISTKFTVTADKFETSDDDDSTTSFYLSNNEWSRGVAVKWAGFMIRNTPENQARYKVGAIVQLPTGDKRTITNVKSEPLTMTVYLTGDPIDGYKVGAPDHFITQEK